MQAQWHQEGVDHGDNDREDDRGGIVEQFESRTQTISDPHAQGTDEEGRHWHHNDEGQEGHEDHLDIVRDDLDQSLVDQGEYRDHEQGDEDLTAVLIELQGQAEDVGGAQVGIERVVGDTTSVAAQSEELGREQRRHDGGADPGVDLELLGGVVGHHDRQEVENAAVHGVNEQQRHRFLLIGGVGVDEVEGLEDGLARDNEGGAQQDRQQRAEGVGQVFEEGVDESVLAARLGPGRSLDVGVRLSSGAGGAASRRFHGRQAVDLLVDAGDRAADDDLVAVPALGDRAHDARDLLDRRLVDDGGVVQLEAESGRAVGEADDVPGAADGLQDRLGCGRCCRHGAPFKDLPVGCLGQRRPTLSKYRPGVRAMSQDNRENATVCRNGAASCRIAPAGPAGPHSPRSRHGPGAPSTGARRAAPPTADSGAGRRSRRPIIPARSGPTEPGRTPWHPGPPPPAAPRVLRR